MTPDDYNRREFKAGRVTYNHVDELMHLLPGILDSTAPSFSRRVQLFQRASGLTTDGKLGPTTRTRLERARTKRLAHERRKANDEIAKTLRITLSNDPLRVCTTGFLSGRGVVFKPAHPSWYGGKIKPVAVVWHNTETRPGTAGAMARRRSRPFGEDPNDREASWHITIDTDGAIWHQVPLDHRAWHAGGKNKKPLVIDGRRIGHPNDHAIGIEMVGFGEVFTPEQVTAAARVADAIERQFGIGIDGHVLHRDVNAVKQCPKKWSEHLPAILTAVYQTE